jgi:hypothetical protein
MMLLSLDKQVVREEVQMEGEADERKLEVLVTGVRSLYDHPILRHEKDEEVLKMVGRLGLRFLVVGNRKGDDLYRRDFLRVDHHPLFCTLPDHIRILRDAVDWDKRVEGVGLDLVGDVGRVDRAGVESSLVNLRRSDARGFHGDKEIVGSMGAQRGH